MNDYRDQIKTKKDLAKLSKAIKASGLSEKVGSMNNALKIVYNLPIDAELKTMKSWNKLGYKVKKGSKSYSFWSAPIKRKKKDSEDTEEKQDGFSFFGMCKLFDKTSVELREVKEEDKKEDVA